MTVHRVPSDRFPRTVWFAMLVVAIVYVLTLAVLPRGGFWITDSDNKFIQMQAIIQQGPGDASIPWPGMAIDPAFDFNPLPEPFSAVEDGRLYAVFSPVFALVSSLPYRLFGETGLYLLPLSGGLLAVLGCGMLARLLGLGGIGTFAATLLAGLATPLWFYSVVFWEHTTAVALSVWAVVFLLRFTDTGHLRDLSLMALTAAFGVYFRDDLYLFCAVLVVILLYAVSDHRVRNAFTAAGIMGAMLIPLWLYQWWAIGHPFGFHLGTHLFSASGILAHVAARPQVIYNMVLAAHPSVMISVVVTLPCAALLFVPESVRMRHRSLLTGAVPMLGMVLAAVVFAGHIATESSILWLLQTNSLLSAAPVLVLAIMPRLTVDENNHRSPRFLVWLVVAGYLAMYLLAAPELGSTGIHWGNRFLLLLYPLLLVLALSAVWPKEKIRIKGLYWGAILLVVLSIGAQVYSVRLLAVKKDFSRRLSEAVADRPEQIVVSTVWWAPQALSREFYTRQVFYASSQDRLQELGQRIVAAGEERVLFITQAGQSPAAGGIRIDDGGLGFFSLDLMPMSLRQPGR